MFLVAGVALAAAPGAMAQTAPAVHSIGISSDPIYAAYGRGEEVKATVTFDAAVDITGTPQLELDFASTPKAADCTAATNTTAMVCSYWVAPGDSAPNGIAIMANKLTGGTITATGTTTAANLDHSAVAIDANHKVDGIRPTLVTTGIDAPTTSTNGTTVILTFSEYIRRVNQGSITIQANGATLSTTGASRAGNKVELTLATALTATATNLTVSLAPNSVFDAAVTNAVVTPDPPGTLKARRGDGEVHLEWVPAAAVPTDPDLAYQLRYGAEGGEYNQWRDIPGSAPGRRNARSYTVTELENGTRYAFEVRVRRGSGFGTATEIRQTPEAARWSVSTNRRSVHEGEDVTLGIATSNAVGFYSAPEALTLAVIGRIELGFATIHGADPEDYEIWVDGNQVQGYTKDITFLNFDKDLDSDPFPAQHFDFEVPVGSTALDVTVKVLVDDDEKEGQEHMSFMVFRGDSLVNADTWDGTGVNIESRDAGVVKQLAVADAEATEGEDPSLDFVVTLAPPAAWMVTVDYATSDGTATAGSDYTYTSGTLTFTANETTKTVSVPVIDDMVEDTPETLTLQLSNAVPPYTGDGVWGSEEAGVLIADPVATGTIRNTEDQAEPRAVSVSDASAAEGDSVVFTVSLSATSSQQVTVEYATSDGTAVAGSDFTAESGTLTFGANETSKTVSVATTDDSVDEENETFTLTLSSPTNATLGDATATGTINDNDVATTPLTASFSDMPASHTGEDFTFGLAFSEEVEVSYVTLRDTAFAVTGGEVRRAQRQQQGSNQAWNITVEPTSANDTVTITLPETTDCDASDAICTDDGRPLSHSLSSVVAGPVIIPTVSVSDASAAEGDVVAFAVSLSATSSQQVTVEYATSDGTATGGVDYTATSGTLTFVANDPTKTVNVATTDDSVDEANETFTLTLSSPANATLGDATATGTINDNDVATTPLTASFSGMPGLAHGRGVHVRAGVQRRGRGQLRDAARHRVRGDRW